MPEETVLDPGQATTAPDEGRAEEAPDADAQTAPDEATPQPPVGDSGEELLSQEEIKKLKDDPAALDKAYKVAYTKKSMALAEERKRFETLTNDPEFIRAKAIEKGLIEQRQAAAEQVTQAADDILAEAEAKFGTDAAKALVPLVTKLVERHLTPIQAEVNARTAKAEWEAFTAKHPDAAEKEAAMMKYGEMYPPVRGTDTQRWLEDMHFLASRETSEADRISGVVSKMKKSAENAESSRPGAPPSRVAGKPPANIPEGAEVRLAMEAALRGERWG